MPAGSTDSNGVYQYGSSDSNATFHGLLNIAGAILSTTIGAILTRLTNTENAQRRSVASLAALDALSDAAIGHTAYLTTPGTTGIDAHSWIAVSGSGATLKWKPDGVIVADTKAHLDSYIAAVVAITDLSFQVGGKAYVSGTKTMYSFTATSGTLSKPVFIEPILFWKRASATVATSTSFSATSFDASATIDNGSFTHSAGVFTCVTAGTYRVTLTLDYAGSATGTRGWRLVGSGGVGTRTVQLSAVGSLDFSHVLVYEVAVAAGETITAQHQQNSGGSLALVGEIEFLRLA